MTLGELFGPEAKLPRTWSETAISGLAADSREVRPGFLFAALPGTLTDGARFIDDALARGAAAILVPQGAKPAAGALPVLEDADPRRRLALLAARFYGMQPETAVAVTGTNGKTSVVSFVRQLWAGLGYQAASLGTVGVVSPHGTTTLHHTTPDPVALHRLLAELADQRVTHLALEASSHGLQQRRIDGVHLQAGAFTNISRDHLDYHPTFEDYFTQKLRLFTELLPEGAVAVVDVDSAEGRAVAGKAQARGLRLISVGHDGADLHLVSAKRDGFAQRLTIAHGGQSTEILLPLVGDFQAANALVAVGLCMATGTGAQTVLPLLANMKGARGRLDLAGFAVKDAPIFIDYAHTPDALAKALDALRPYARNRLIALFGCGGDRDRGKRPQMGKAATDKADLVYVTDDNPRSEDPAAIRRAILAEAPGAIEIGDRAQAIAAAISAMQKGDVLLVAGKGHESGQTIGDKVIPFSDHEAIAGVLEREPDRV